MYFFDILDYYSNCFFGPHAHVNVTQYSPYHYNDELVSANATFEAMIKAYCEFIFASRCNNDTACSANDQLMIDNFVQAEIEFLKARAVFFNAYLRPAHWNLVNGSITTLTGVCPIQLPDVQDITDLPALGVPGNVVLVTNLNLEYVWDKVTSSWIIRTSNTDPTMLKYYVPVLPGSFLITTQSFSIDFGTGLTTQASLEAYKTAYQNFECEMRKLVSYFTGATFKKSSLTGFQELGQVEGFNCSPYTDYKISGNIDIGVPVNVTFKLPYANGNGGPYGAYTVQSSNIPTLTATLQPGTFFIGVGELTFQLTGTIPVGTVSTICYIPISFLGHTCVVGFSIPYTIN